MVDLIEEFKIRPQKSYKTKLSKNLELQIIEFVSGGRGRTSSTISRPFVERLLLMIVNY